MSIEDAIDLIRSKYEDNKGKKWVRNPVAYTLYEVWRITDSKEVYRPSEPPKEETPTGPYDLLYEEGGPDA